MVEIIEENASGASVDKTRYHITEKGFMFIGMKLGGKKAGLHLWKVVVFVDALKEKIERLKLEGPAPQPQIETTQQQEVKLGLQPLYQCAHCKEWLPSGAFNRDNSRNPPRQSWCRQCHKDRAGEMKLIEWIPENDHGTGLIIVSTKIRREMFCKKNLAVGRMIRTGTGDQGRKQLEVFSLSCIMGPCLFAIFIITTD